MKIYNQFDIFGIIFFLLIFINSIITFLIYLKRKKENKNNIFLEYSQLLLTLITFLLALKVNEKIYLIIFIFSAIIILIIRQLKKVRSQV
jgi:predicted membrane-bound mannosyltransferase